MPITDDYTRADAGFDGRISGQRSRAVPHRSYLYFTPTVQFRLLGPVRLRSCLYSGTSDDHEFVKVWVQSGQMMVGQQENTKARE
jgi:hypothetical protein